MSETTAKGRGKLDLQTGANKRPPTGAFTLPTASTVPEKKARSREDTTITHSGLERRVHDASAAMTLSLSERFDCEDEIGRGGMASIYGVYERSLGRRVALKALHETRVGDERSKHRFMAEAQITGQLEHPNIVPVYEIGEDDSGRTFFTMRLIEGDTFTDTLEDTPMDGEALESALDVFLKVCDALTFAHSRGVLHRDVKPSNIMVGAFGQVYLVDWGVAFISDKVSSSGEPKAEAEKRTTTLSIPVMNDEGLIVGTYAYMSPEQARGETSSFDARTDVFGMGAVLFRMVTGRPPFRAESAERALALAVKSKLPEVEISSPLGQALLDIASQAMHSDQEDRFQNMAALKRAVLQIRRGRRRHAVQAVSAGSIVVHEGDQGEAAYYIRKGAFSVYRSEKGRKILLNRLGPGDVFGEAAVFTENPRSATVECSENAQVIQVDRRSISAALSLDSWMGAFVKALGARFEERSQRVIELEAQQTKTSVLMRLLQHFLNTQVERAEVNSLCESLGLERSALEYAFEGTGLFEIDDGYVCRIS